jgi:hypothetical protein
MRGRPRALAPASSDPDDAAAPATVEDGVMQATTSAERLRELRFNVGAAALLTRVFAPHLVKHLIERLEINERVRRRRMSPQQRRIRRSLRIGAYAVGVAAAGVAVARIAKRDGDHAPEIDRA